MAEASCSRRILALLLFVALLVQMGFSSVSAEPREASSLQTSVEVFEEQHQIQLDWLETHQLPLRETDDFIPVLVQLKRTPQQEQQLLALQKDSDPGLLSQLITHTAEQQQQWMDQAVQKGLYWKDGVRTQLVANQISGWIRKSEISEWFALPGVESIRPNESVIPAAVDWEEESAPRRSRRSLEARSYDWKTLKGEGRVIAVIDSGFDIHHKDMYLADVTKAAFPSSEKLQEKLQQINSGVTDISAQVRGEWGTEKFPFVYHYVKENADVYQGGHSHGMHVAGIAAANGTVSPGQAPEAQLLGMAVFREDGTTEEAVYTKAIDDALKLGADTLNLSLGKDFGVQKNLAPGLQQAIERSRSLGALVVIAGGNSNYPNAEVMKPRPDNPNYSIVGDPAVAKDSLAVASLNAPFFMTPTLTLLRADGSDAQEVSYVVHAREEDLKTLAKQHASLRLVDVSLGRLPGMKDPEGKTVAENDYQGKDVTGNVALIQRGIISFEDKIRGAKEQGAVLAILYNNEGVNQQFSPLLKEPEIPVVSLTQEDGEKLCKQIQTEPGQIKLHTELKSFANPQGGKLSDFSSWGPGLEGDLKPEVTAQGGEIYNLQPKDSYGLMSGTSMASPQVAGLAAKLRQRVEEDDRIPNYTGTDLHAFLKNVIMSTAKPVYFDAAADKFWSPRKQGAGLMQEEAALTTMAYAVGPSGIAKICLGDLNQLQVPLQGNLVNLYKDRTLQFRPRVRVQMDALDEDGTIQVGQSETLLDQTFDPIVLAPGQQTPFLLPLNLQEAGQKLLEKFPNGHFLEGFVRFESLDENPEEQCDLVLPWIGFYGGRDGYEPKGFQDLPLFEKPVYDFGSFNADSPVMKRPQFYQGGGVYNNVFTSAVSSKVIEDMGAELVLGERVTQVNERQFDAGRIAISPNGDRNQDYLALRVVFQSFFTYDSMQIFNEEGDTLYYQSPVTYRPDDPNPLSRFGYPNAVQRSESGDISYKFASTMLDSWVWNGQGKADFDPETEDRRALPMLEDGTYRLRFTAFPYLDPQEEEGSSFEFPVILDRVKPVLQEAHYSDGQYTGKVSDDRAGIKFVKLVYSGSEGRVEEILPVDDNGNFKVQATPEQMANWSLLIEDYAGNQYEETLDLTLLDESQVGSLEIKFIDEQGNVLSVDPSHYQLEVLDVEHQVKRQNLNRLPVGHYRVSLNHLNLRYEETPEADRVQEVDIVGGQKKICTFRLHQKPVDTLSLIVQFEPHIQELPKDFRVYLIPVSGDSVNKREYEAVPMGANGYSVDVDPGQYEIRCSGIPEHYILVSADPVDTLKDQTKMYQVLLVDEREVGQLMLRTEFDSSVSAADRSGLEFMLVTEDQEESQVIQPGERVPALLPGRYFVYVSKNPAGLYTDEEVQEVVIEKQKQSEVTFVFENPLETKGKLKIRSLNDQGEPIPMQYQIESLQGEKMEIQPQPGDPLVYSLPMGRYTVTPDTGDSLWIAQEEAQAVRLNRSQPEVELVFHYRNLNQVPGNGRLNFINSYVRESVAGETEQEAKERKVQEEKNIEALFHQGTFRVQIERIQTGETWVHEYKPQDLFNGNQVRELPFGQYRITMLDIPDGVLVQPVTQEVIVRSTGAFPDVATFTLSFVRSLNEGVLPGSAVPETAHARLEILDWPDETQGVLPNQAQLEVVREEHKDDLTFTFNIHSAGQLLTLPTGAKYTLRMPLPTNWNPNEEFEVRDAQGKTVPFVLQEGEIVLQDAKTLGPYRLTRKNKPNPEPGTTEPPKLPIPDPSLPISGQVGFQPIVGGKHEVNQYDPGQNKQGTVAQKANSDRKNALPKTGESRQNFDVILFLLAGLILGGLGNKIVRKRNEI